MRSFRKIILALSVLFLTSCSEDVVEVKLEMFLPKLEEMLVQIPATIILLVLLYQLVWKPVRKVLNTRREHVEKDIQEAQYRKSLAQEELIDAKQTKLNAQNEYMNVVEQAKVDALNERDKIIKTAHDVVEKEKSRAQDQIATERKQAEAEMKKQIVDIAFKAAEKLLEREVDKKDNEKIVEDFVSGEIK